MKIGSSEEIIKQACSGAAKKADSGTGGNFGEILNETMDKSQMNNPGIRNVSNMGDVAHISLDRFHSGNQPPLVDRVDAFLDILDTYQQKLGDRKFSLRDIYPLVQDLETGKDSLIPDFNSLSDKDGLKGILDQTLIAASLEIAKFNRGDYIAH